MRWFKHMTSSAGDEKLSAIQDQCGLAGYGFFWRVLELIGAQVDESGKNFCAYPKRVWCNKLAINHQTWSKMIASCQQAGVFIVSETEQGIRVESPNILKYRDEYTERKAKKSGQYPDDIGRLSGPRARLTDTDTEEEYNPPLTPPSGGECVSLFTLGTDQGTIEGKQSSGPEQSALGTPEDNSDGGKQSSGKNETTRNDDEEDSPPARRNKRKVKGADLPPYDAEFEECWKAYPNKSGKGDAWKAVLDLRKAGVLPPDLVSRIENRALETDWLEDSRDPKRRRFIPHMATWLHRCGWEDEGCLPEVVPETSPEEERRIEIMGKYNFGMPLFGESADEIHAKNARMELELNAAGL